MARPRSSHGVDAHLIDAPAIDAHLIDLDQPRPVDPAISDRVDDLSAISWEVWRTHAGQPVAAVLRELDDLCTRTGLRPAEADLLPAALAISVGHSYRFTAPCG